PGCGKTVLPLQILVNRAIHHASPGIFVAFEETASRVAGNAESFGWNMQEINDQQLSFVNAHTRSDVVKAGAFDLAGLLAALEVKARGMGAKLIVFDAIDVLLSRLDDPPAEGRELYHIHEWLSRHELTGILTTKVDDHKPALRYGFMPFMADCLVLLSQRVTDQVTVREMRVLKYRGSTHVLNAVPFVIGPQGMEVGSSNGVHPEPQPLNERISTGIERLDEMLDGGIYRGTNALITGSSGSGKSTLAGAFIAAACQRNERSLFISFDENSRDIARDLAHAGINLAPHLELHRLRMETVRSASASSEEHYIRIKRLISEYQPRCLVIDPLSALECVGGGRAARAIAERLIYLCRNSGITALFTSLLEGTDPHLETTSLHISTISDTWMEISYRLQGGERNRALTIVKSRGSNHSNQQRELIFSDSGITLANPYSGGGEVLMGTMRIEKETAMHAEVERKQGEIEQKRRELEVIMAERDHRLEAAQRELAIRSEELTTLRHAGRPQNNEALQQEEGTVQKPPYKLLHAQPERSQQGLDEETSAKAKTRRKSK
ncbi:MAG TPA: circadian clock protein KaiC, partial [Chthoniobacteraceae bacterium]|nr:circadian clock protein KaiC [Chthoniobacteraceae bacterium]